MNGRIAAGALSLVFAAAMSACGASLETSADAPAGALERQAPREVRVDGSVHFHDPQIGLAVEYPAGWHRERAVTGLVVPREILVLASYPLRRGGTAGECAPDHARADMPVDGTFIWLLEYRPPRGDVWATVRRSGFPPNASGLEVRAGDLAKNVSCFPGSGYSTSFDAAGRPLQLLVAFGSRPNAEQLREANAILRSLRFEELPPPPPDPYAGWPLVHTNPGDSLRPPPGWPASAAMFPLEKTPKPRPLFFAANRALRGLPGKLVAHVDALPGPFPTAARGDAFPDDGVLLWVLEEEPGGESEAFPHITRRWPVDFEDAEPPTSSASGLRWRRAGGSFRGHRFTVWIVAGPDASDADVGLAHKSAASLAVSGCFRDSFVDCRDD